MSTHKSLNRDEKLEANRKLSKCFYDLKLYCNLDFKELTTALDISKSAVYRVKYWDRDDARYRFNVYNRWDSWFSAIDLQIPKIKSAFEYFDTFDWDSWISMGGIDFISDEFYCKHCGSLVALTSPLHNGVCQDCYDKYFRKSAKNCNFCGNSLEGISISRGMCQNCYQKLYRFGETSKYPKFRSDFISATNISSCPACGKNQIYQHGLCHSCYHLKKCYGLERDQVIKYVQFLNSPSFQLDFSKIIPGISFDFVELSNICHIPFRCKNRWMDFGKAHRALGKTRGIKKQYRREVYIYLKTCRVAADNALSYYLKLKSDYMISAI